MSAPTYTSPKRSTLVAGRARRRRRTAVGALAICSALVVATGAATVDVAFVQPPLLAAEPTVAPLVVDDDLSPLRPNPQAALLPVWTRPFEGAPPVAASRSSERAEVVAAPAATPRRVAADAEPRLLRACGYRASIQQRPELDATQRRNAATIVDMSRLLGLPARAAVIGIATAFQESNLRNLDWGDRDSLGLFQQRPSMGWGAPKYVQTPTFAAAAFFVPLVQSPGWRRMPLTRAAQLIQRSAYPSRYAQWELAAATIVKKQLKVDDTALNCRR